MVEMDRYEFTSKIIGEGSEEMLREIFNDNAQFDTLVKLGTEQFEDVLSEKLSQMTIKELTLLAKKYDYDVNITGLIFERFLDPKKDGPDIDSDFNDKHLREMKSFVNQKYGIKKKDYAKEIRKLVEKSNINSQNNYVSYVIAGKYVIGILYEEIQGNNCYFIELKHGYTDKLKNNLCNGNSIQNSTVSIGDFDALEKEVRALITNYTKK